MIQFKKKETEMNAFHCPGCHNVTGGDEKFCMKCGYPLNTTCPDCGHSWRYMFVYDFCPECGKVMRQVEKNVQAKQHSRIISSD